LVERSKVIREVIVEETRDSRLALSIPSVAITNTQDKTPDDKLWLSELYVKMLSRISKNGAMPFLVATAKRVKISPHLPTSRQVKTSPRSQRQERIDSTSYGKYLDEPRAGSSQQGTINPPVYGKEIVLSKEQKKEVQAVISKNFDFAAAVDFTMAGATIGSLLGPAGAAIGGVVGAIISIFAWTWD